MKVKVLSQTNPHLRSGKKAQRYRVRSLASSTAIETGESISHIEEKINRLQRAQNRVKLGGCPRIEAVARESGFESIFLIKWGEYLLYLTNLIGKMGQNPLYRSRLSILGQPPSLTKVFIWP